MMVVFNNKNINPSSLKIPMTNYVRLIQFMCKGRWIFI